MPAAVLRAQDTPPPCQDRRVTRTAPLVIVAAALLSLAGCGDGTFVPAAGETGAATSPAPPAPSASPGETPSAEPTPSASPTPAPTDSAPVPVPSATPTPTTAPTTAGGQASASVRADVERAAPALERFYQDREYPLDLAQVRTTLAEAGVVLTAGNTIAGYDYDGDAVEFELCVENASGAFATYDTAPMTVGRSGESGGCPTG